MGVINYKCPNCSAGLTYDGKTKKMVCAFCGSSFDPEEIEKTGERGEEREDTSPHWEGFEAHEWDDASGIRVWHCPSCGAEIFAEETEGARKCPYCDNPMVMPEQFAGMYRPEGVIPFKKTRQEALEALKSHYLGKPLLPKVFKDRNHLEEITPLYVPFWLFDLKASGRYRYEGINTRVYTQGDTQCTESSFFNILRSGTMDFSGIPVDGSQKIDDTMMEAIEPYNYAEMEPFDIRYLSGYGANRYDVEPDELTDRVYERIQSSMDHAVRETVIGYEQVIPTDRQVRIAKKGPVHYCLLPVWFLNTRWNGKTYSFAMNGQTGKFIGDLPVGRELMVSYWFRWHIPLTLVGAGCMIALRLMGVI